MGRFPLRLSHYEWQAIYLALKKSAESLDDQEASNGYNMLANQIRQELERRGHGLDKLAGEMGARGVKGEPSSYKKS
jgi:hypothetical protein